MPARIKKFPPKPPLPVEGWPRPYMRDGVPGLPVERQEEMLAALGLELTDDKAYIDSLSRKRIVTRGPLPERDQAVTPAHHGETIYVASLRVLGWDHLDAMRAMSTAFERDCRIYCADTGAVYSGATPADEMIKAFTRAEEARRRARTSRATEGQLSRRAKHVEEGLAIARRVWSGPLTVAQIAEMAHLSTRTLYAHLPPRSEARDEQKKGKPHA